MLRHVETERILVISSSPDLVALVRQAVPGTLEVSHAADAARGLELARREIPLLIVLGYLAPAGATPAMYHRLREGWITKHIPRLVVALETPGHPENALAAEERALIPSPEYVTLPAAAASRLREVLQQRLRDSANPLRQALLDPDRFAVTWEQVPGRGAFEIAQEDVIEDARLAAGGGLVSAISVTDSPGGNPAINTELLGHEIKNAGIEPLIHLTSRDRNRNQLESMLFSLAAGGIRNVLALTGDYPSELGFGGQARPVFDVDPVHILQLISSMNRGLDYEVFGKARVLAPTDFFAGVAVSPFKAEESELQGQYYKLQKKIAAGADFIISQIGFDARKMHELMLWLKMHHYDLPVIANIYVMPLGSARVIQANRIPGCVVTDTLVGELEAETGQPDRGKSARVERAAKMYAVARGLGYAGAHIGGHNISYQTVAQVVVRGEALARDWQSLLAGFNFPQPGGAYYFERDPATGLNLEAPTAHRTKPKAPPIFWFSYLAHPLIFDPRSLVFKVFHGLARRIDRGALSRRVFGWFERIIKVFLFDCMDCGDCSLVDVAYLCPLSQCPKNQRNGPCGGSYHGWCEVYPKERKCIWVKAYRRLRATHDEDTIAENVVPPVNWELWETPSWLNFHAGRDHTSMRLGINRQAAKTPRN